MDILPSEYKRLELSKSEKLFIGYSQSQEEYGLLLLNINPAMISNDSVHALIIPDGVLLIRFMDQMDDPNFFEMVMKSYIDGIHVNRFNVVINKLIDNKSLIDKNGNLKFSVSIVYVFPKLDYEDIQKLCSDDAVIDFANSYCMFKDEFSSLKSDYKNIMLKYLSSFSDQLSEDKITISDNNVNSIIQRIAPEYTTIRVETMVDKETKSGANDELLVVTEDDLAVKAFRLDEDQVNIINKMAKGEQLILACAGSGKSVLLIAKCFKAASMNPEKNFLITCRSNKLCSLYTWFIDRAGLRAKNVSCMTFHNLCKKLLQQNGLSAPHGKFDDWITNAQYYLNNGKIQQRYYGIFIDEVQEFTTEWYKFCYQLLENKESNDHIFVICGDKTQKIMKDQKHGKAPWNAGEGYPSYRGGNKSIRIEKNYRNCIEINEYINKYVTRAKSYLSLIENTTELDPDMFLRGKSVYHSRGVTIKSLTDKSNIGEATEVLNSINYCHDVCGIPYDEIAIVMNNGSYKKRFKGWKDSKYNLEESLTKLLDQYNIQYCKMYSTENEWSSYYGSDGGVKLIKLDSVLGLDFRGVIICGLITLGEHDQTKKINLKRLQCGDEESQRLITGVQDNIRRLYVACTRAKDVLHIIKSEETDKSIYMKMLQDSFEG